VTGSGRFAGIERERAVRIDAEIPVEFREKGRMRIRQMGRIVNVSLTGLYVGVLHPPHLNEIVELWIPGVAWDGGEGKIRIRGQVRWWRSDPAERLLARGFGVKILDYGSAEARDRYRAVVARMNQEADDAEDDEEETIVE
jgi:hypothetical protein